MEQTATEILRHYERTNRAVGRDRDAVIRLLRIREAMDAKAAGRPEVALEVCYCLYFYYFNLPLINHDRSSSPRNLYLLTVM
jgi:hypothetical protein